MSEEKQAEIIRRVYNGTYYSHAENVLHRLRELEVTHGLEKAVDILHDEV